MANNLTLADAIESAERVATIRELYPQYSFVLDEAVRNGAQTGVRLRADAEELLSAETKQRVKEENYKLTVRVSIEFMGLETIDTMLKACGYPSKTAWVLACLKRLNGEYAARQRGKAKPAEGSENG